MTIKKRLYISNILMLIIPAMVSLLMILGSFLFYLNAIYKQFMDETMEESNITYIQRLLVDQAQEMMRGETNAAESTLYQTMEKYLISQDMTMEIYDGENVAYILGVSDRSENDACLSAAMRSLGGEGTIAKDGNCLYGEGIVVDGKPYTVLIYGSIDIEESQFNELLVKYIIVILFVMIVVAVIVTNCFLTRFIFRKIEAPLDILSDGVRQIQEGHLDYRIEYNGEDEFLKICNDFNNMAAKLKESIDIIQKNEQNRKELIAGISHDLRTPLTSIKAYIEGLLEGIAATPQMQQKYMKTILAKANDIDRMVDKLFLFSKLDLGDCPFYPERLNAEKEIRSVISTNEKEYRERGMTIICEEIPETLSFYADPVQLRSAITNILENSLKYKDEEKVMVRIRCEDAGEYVRVVIDDNGPGVPPEALPKLFDVFYRSDSSRNKPDNGSGLGLAITAKILERFGGTIHAENMNPKGLRIVMTIPKEGKHE